MVYSSARPKNRDSVNKFKQLIVWKKGEEKSDLKEKIQGNDLERGKEVKSNFFIFWRFPGGLELNKKNVWLVNYINPNAILYTEFYNFASHYGICFKK